MKKVYCYHCQKDINPLKLLKWRFCPHCFRPTNDGGDGFYLVCDRCGANMPVQATNCLKCGHGLNGNPDDQPIMLPAPKTLIHSLLQVILFLFSIFIAIAVIFISFKLLLFFLIIGMGFAIYNTLKHRI